MNTLLNAAMQYRDSYGWSILPVKGKKPNLCQWKPYQKTRPNDKELRDIFDLPGTTGLAVICGPVSKNLVVRDFDDETAYHRWSKAHPQLAKDLPTARTGRGFHVYGRSQQIDRITKLDDGELRGGGYVLLPPSQHPDGGRYTWIVEPGQKIPQIKDLNEAGLTSSWMVDEQAQHGIDTPPYGGICGYPDITACSTYPSNSLHVSCMCPKNVDEAIATTLPTGPGQRNGKVFELAMKLRALLGADAKANELRPIVRKWYEQALPFIRTKDFSTTWSDFIIAWGRIKSLPLDMETVVADVAAMPDPPAALKFDSDQLRSLVRLCACLQQRWGDQPFFLSVRKAADTLTREPDGGCS